jgi:hypothetical protein
VRGGEGRERGGRGEGERRERGCSLTFTMTMLTSHTTLNSQFMETAMTRSVCTAAVDTALDPTFQPTLRVRTSANKLSFCSPSRYVRTKQVLLNYYNGSAV